MSGWVLTCLSLYRERLYANVGEYPPPVEEEEDPYSYGDDTIYDSICYYQSPVRHTHTQLVGDIHELLSH